VGVGRDGQGNIENGIIICHNTAHNMSRDGSGLINGRGKKYSGLVYQNKLREEDFWSVLGCTPTQDMID
jgi:hypothetical protein